MQRAAGFIVGVMALGLAWLCPQPASAWDGRWAQAEDRQTRDIIDDPHSTEGMGVEKNRPQTFFIPPTPLFRDVDPEEMSENKGKDYSPYALLQMTQNLTVQGQALTKGYYLVKPGNLGDGSPATHLLTPDPSGAPPSNPSNSQGQTATKPPKQNPVYRVFVLKQMGKVVAVLPIDEQAPYEKQKGDKLPKKAVAWIEFAELDPVPMLKFYYKKRIYTSRLAP